MQGRTVSCKTVAPFFRNLDEPTENNDAVGMAVAMSTPADDVHASTISKEYAMEHDSILKAAITGLLAFSGLVVAGNALAADDGKEQCAGIAKAGKNDCATSMNACHGHATNGSNRSISHAQSHREPKGRCASSLLLNVVGPTLGRPSASQIRCADLVITTRGPV
jgi:uncharacterized membrane protein